MANDGPVFILGAPRSGTSLLYRVLSQHPHVTYLNQFVRKAPAMPELTALNRLPRRRTDWRDQTWFSDTGSAYVYGQRRGWIRRGFPQPVEGEPFFGRWGLPEAVSSSAADAWSPDALRVGVGRVRKADGGRRFVSKRINHNRRVAALAKAFPDAQFVHLVRDGRAAARSLTRVDWWSDCDVWSVGSTPSQWAKAGGDPWELAVRHWAAEVSAVDDGLTGVPETSVLHVRYEELAADLPGQIARVAAFADLASETEWTTRVAALGGRPPTSGSSVALTEAQLETAEKWQAEVLARHGYAWHRG